MAILTLSDFDQAFLRIKPYILESPTTFHAPSQLWIKWENRQPTQSFKPRGAFNKILRLPEEKMKAGLITASAGNHGQAVALAAQKIGAEATVYLPESTPRIKVSRIKELGAWVERVPGLFGDAEANAISAARVSGATFISAYNDEEVIAGAGSIALEWVKQVPKLKRLLVPVGGGGLISGVGLAAKAIDPQIEIIGVLSEASPYMFHHFYYGHMDKVVEKATLTDGLAGAIEDGSITLKLIHQACDSIIQVTEEEIGFAIAYYQFEMGEVVEGSGAVGLAAVLAGKLSPKKRATGVLVTGGNIDRDVHEKVCSYHKNAISSFGT